MCPSGITCLPADCCVSELALCLLDKSEGRIYCLECNPRITVICSCLISLFLCFIGAQSNVKADDEIDIGYSSSLTPVRGRNRGIKFATYPLLVAIEYSHAEVFSFLISHGSKIDINIYNNRTPLHITCSEGTLDMVKKLVNNGSCINAET